MNRRELLKSLPACAAIPLLGAGSLNTCVMALASSTWRLRAAQKILSESGSMWLASAPERWRSVNPVLVTFDDGYTVEIQRVTNDWRLIERLLTDAEVKELSEYKSGLMPIYKREIRMGDHVGTDWCLRGYIKNGRRPGWNMSAEKIG